MKKLHLLLIAIIMIGASWAQSVEVVDACFLRSAPGALDNAGWAKAGQKFQVLDEEGAFYEVEFVSGTEHSGKTGWVFRGMIEDGKIKGDGCNVRSAPGMNAEIIFKARGGASVKVVRKDVKWIKVGEGQWIFHTNVRRI